MNNGLAPLPRGLSDVERAELLAQFGPNELAAEKPPGVPKRLWSAFRSPFNFLLLALAGVSAATGDARAATIIGAMVLLSSALRFVQENRASQAAQW